MGNVFEDIAEGVGGFFEDPVDAITDELSRFDDNILQPGLPFISPISWLNKEALSGLIPEAPDVNVDIAKGILLNRQGNDLKIPVIYGSRRVGGSVDFIGVSGTENEYLHFLLTLCEGEISAINNVYLNDIAGNDAQYDDPDATAYTTGTLTATLGSAVVTGSGTTWTGNVAVGDVFSISTDDNFYYVLTVDSNTQITLTTKYLGTTGGGKTYKAVTSLIGIEKYVGTDTQAADADLVSSFTPWTTAHQLKGVAYLVAKIKYSQGAFSGFPRIVADVDGKLIAETRTAYTTGTLTATNGSAVVTGSGTTWTGNVAVGDVLSIGTDRGFYFVLTVDSNTQITMSTNYTGTTGAGKNYKAMTLAFSANSSLCIYDFFTSLRYGKGLPTTSLNIAAANSAADTCDESITNFTPGGSSINRYECNGVVDTNRRVIDNLSLLRETCRAYTPYIAGQYHIIIDKDETPSFTFDKTNIIGGWSFRGAQKRDKLNKIKIRFTNPLKNWQQDIAIEEDSTLLAEDNNLLLEKTLTMPFETDVYRAKYHGEVELKKSRQGISVSFLASWEALQVEMGEVVSVTHTTPGWTAKAFRLINIGLLSSGFVACELVEHESTVYDRTVPAAAATAPDTNLPNPFSVVAPTSLVITQNNIIRPDGSMDNQVIASWTAAIDQFVDDYDVQYKLSSDSNWLTANVARGTVQILISGLATLAEYDFQVRSSNVNGYKSIWLQSLNQLIGDVNYIQFHTFFESLDGFNIIVTGPGATTITESGVELNLSGTASNAASIRKIASHFSSATWANSRTVKSVIEYKQSVASTIRAQAGTGNATPAGSGQHLMVTLLSGSIVSISSNGVASTQKTMDASPAVNTVYKIEIRWDAAAQTAEFYLNGVLKTTHTSSDVLPSGTNDADNLFLATAIASGPSAPDFDLYVGETRFVQYE